MNSEKRVYLNDTWLLPECHRRVTLNFPLVFWLQHFRRKLSGRRRLSSWARSCTRPYVAVVFFVFCLSLRNIILITLSGDCWLNCWVRCTFKRSSNTLRNKGQDLKGKKEKKLKWWFDSMIKVFQVIEFINFKKLCFWSFKVPIPGEILLTCIFSLSEQSILYFICLHHFSEAVEVHPESMQSPLWCHRGHLHV